MSPVVASACLGTAAVVVAWPHSSRARRRRLAPRTAGGVASAGGVVWAAGLIRRAAGAEPRLVTAGLAVGCGVGGAALGGPVAAIAATVYGALLAHGLLRRHRQRAAALVRARALDDLGGLAADLRAGLPVTESTSDGRGALGAFGERAGAAFTLAAVTGAPVADLLDRIEADGRASDRAEAAAEAQRAGVRATALLLACLPVAGIALGYAIGADPLHVLLRTPVGAGCALGAVALQVAGLAWTGRLARIGAVR